MMKGPICPCCQQDVKAQATRDALIRVVDAMLLFFKGGAWTPEEQLEWITLTGNSQCDHAHALRLRTA